MKVGRVEAGYLRLRAGVLGLQRFLRLRIAVLDMITELVLQRARDVDVEAVGKSLQVLGGHVEFWRPDLGLLLARIMAGPTNKRAILMLEALVDNQGLLSLKVARRTHLLKRCLFQPLGAGADCRDLLFQGSDLRHHLGEHGSLLARRLFLDVFGYLLVRHCLCGGHRADQWIMLRR